MCGAQAASLAIRRQGTNEALTLGYSSVTAMRSFQGFDFYWQPPAPVYDPTRRSSFLRGRVPTASMPAIILRQLLRQYRREVVDNLLAVGIRSKLRPIERAAFIKEYSEKKLRTSSRPDRRLRQCGDPDRGPPGEGGISPTAVIPTSMALQEQASELDRPRAKPSSTRYKS